MERSYCVYIMASESRRLYVGCTSDLPRRIVQHRTRYFGGHTARYAIDRLVWYECGGDARAMIQRERRLKGWLRRRKIALIEKRNPAWRDLGCELGLPPHAPRSATRRRTRDPSLRSG